MTEALVGQRLSARICGVCRLLTVPGEPFACERCGTSRDEHVDTACDFSGTIVALAVVHRHAHATPPTPFTVVEVALDAGPVVRAQLVERQMEEARIGDRVVGKLTDDHATVVRARESGR